MVAIGRALMGNPRLLMCDEISLGLAPVIIKDIYAALPAILGEGRLRRHRRAGHRPGAERRRGRLLLAGRPREPQGQGVGPLARRHLRRLFRGLTMLGWLDTILQGLMLGGLYALFATGLSLTFGVMRLVNIAHGDLSILAAYLALVTVQSLGISPFAALLVVVPVMAAIGYGLQLFLLNDTLGDDILPPLLVTFGLSIILQNGLMEVFSADSRGLSVGALQTASLPLGGGVAVGVFPAMTLATAVAVLALMSWLFNSTTLGRALRATSDDQTTAQLMGIDNRRLYAVAMAISMAVVAIAGVFLAIRTTFDPTVRTGAPPLRLRGGHHRRPRLAVGHARGRDGARRRADGRLRAEPGLGHRRRPYRVSRRARRPAERPLPQNARRLRKRHEATMSSPDRRGSAARRPRRPRRRLRT